MSFPREKRLWLTALAFVAAWPLPFNDLLEPPVFLLFLSAVTWIGWRAWQGAERWLSERQLNLLGLLYLPVLVVDVGGSGRIQLLRPILHLILFGIVAKLGSLVRERDKWHAWVGLFFLFLAAMATSVHPAVVVYLLSFVGLSLASLMRFVYLHHLTSFGYTPQHLLPPLPMGRFLAGSLVAMLLLALPLFAIFPRLRSPYISGLPGAGFAGPDPLIGFSDSMSLGGIGRLQENQAVALRVEFEGPPPVDAKQLRIKMATYERWNGLLWQRTEESRRLPELSPNWVPLRQVPPPLWSANLVLEPLDSVGMPLLPGTVGFEIELPGLRLDRGGAVLRSGSPLRQPLDFRVTYDNKPSVPSLAEPPREENEPALDRTGVTPRIQELARSLAGDGSSVERARRLEMRLQKDYEYALEFPAGTDGSPIETFLFEARRGHCEYFASALVLLLRAEGIPARLVTGFYGAEQSWWEKSWVVRQSGAHAWVEAWTPESGWVTLDPTPPSGLPSASRMGAWALLRQGYDALLFRWDRWILSFDFEDQMTLADRLRSWLERWRSRWRNARSLGLETVGRDSRELPSGGLVRPSWWSRNWKLLGLALTIGLGLWVLWKIRQREPWRARTAYLALRELLAKHGVLVTAATAPLELLERIRDLPEPVYRQAGQIVAVYLREAFSPKAPPAEEFLGLRAVLENLERELRARRGRVRYFTSPDRTGWFSRRRVA